MEILPGVHWLKAGYANAYLCVEDEGLTLIDSGTPRQAEKILSAVRDLGRAPSELRRILITHADFDHAGSAAELHRRTGATVVAAPLTLDYLRRGRASKHVGGPLASVGDLFNRYKLLPEGALAPAVAGSVLPVLGGLQVLATPGHTPDHHAFYSPSRGVLFAGDALSTGSGGLGIAHALITADSGAARRSARQLLRLTPAVFACGHGDPLLSHSDEDLMRLRQALD